jgi:Cu-Zn family superoxide dismutase
MRILRNFVITVATASLALSVAACGGSESSSPSEQAPSSTAASGPSPSAAPNDGADVTATFGTDPEAMIYDKQIIPQGSHVQVIEEFEGNSTKVSLTVRGLLPNRAYGAHVHQMPCGPKGDDAGPHFQHMADPTKPSVNPAYANPQNEIWLDLKTDEQGNATSTSTVPWKFTPPASAGSVVIHAEKTQTGPGKAGTAGARAACVSAKF